MSWNVTVIMASGECQFRDKIPPDTVNIYIMKKLTSHFVDISGIYKHEDIQKIRKDFRKEIKFWAFNVFRFLFYAHFF